MKFFWAMSWWGRHTGLWHDVNPITDPMYPLTDHAD